jgi:hypothetical protein
MPNLAFHFEVLKEVITERAAAGDPLAKKLVQNNFNNSLMPFAVLGAMGPDTLRYMPISSALAKFLSGLVPVATSGVALTPAQIQTKVMAAQAALEAITSTSATKAQQALAYELYFNPVGAIYSVLFTTVVIPLWPIFAKVNSVLDQFAVIVQNQDQIALLEFVSTLEDLKNVSSQTVGVTSTVTVLRAVIGAIITEGPWMEMNQPFPPPADASLDRRHEFLRWHHTGTFARNLQANAASENQKAFAFGWLCHVATSVTAEPFINNIVGGPYRTHWWRNRLAGNFVDSWTFGFFEQNPLPTMTGDDPSPIYCDPNTGDGWPSLCDANLQSQFNVANLGGPASPGVIPDAVSAMASGDVSAVLASSPFPQEISSLFSKTINQTYPLATQPIVGLDSSNTPIPAFASDTFARAYVGAFAVYWFMTSGGGVVGNNPAGVPTGQPEPTWISSLNTQTPQTPSLTQAGLSIGGIICALLELIIGAIATIFGAPEIGIVAIIALTQTSIIDWSTVANELFWVRKVFADEANLLRDALVWSGLAYPAPILLGMVDPDGNTLPVTDLTVGQQFPTSNVPATQGIPLCKSNFFGGEVLPFPRQLDTTNPALPQADANFDTFPTLVAAEEPTTNNLVGGNLYPNTFILKSKPVTNGGMASGSGFPTSGKSFGDAVANSIQLIITAGKSLPDYNLDADRGYGWLTWNPQTGSNPFTPPIVAVQDT